MKKIIPCTPDAATGTKLAATDSTPLGDKAAVGQMAGGFSKRWVDDQMRLGMPHLRLGRRRVRFDMAEVRAWLSEKYHTQRLGAAPSKST